MPFPNQYRPFQINHGLLYRQLPPSEHLQEVVAFFWELRNPAPEWVPYNIIADGCVDFIAGLYGDHQLKISVSQWAPTTLPLPPGASLWGVRLYPATFSLVFGVPMSALTTHYWFDFAEISDLPDLPFLSEALAEQDSLLQKKAVFEQFLTRYMLQYAPCEDSRFFNVISDIYQQSGHLWVDNQKKWYISPRQLRRLFDRYIGFSPKAFSQIVRMQNALQRLPQSGFSLHDWGFYDQAHFSREIKLFTGYPPSKIAQWLRP